MKRRFMTIDDDADYRVLLSHHLSTHWPQADVRLYDPGESGRLPEDFSGASCDVVILGDRAGGEDAIDWLKQFRRVPRFPAILFLGYLWVLVDPDRLAWHDRWTGTRLVVLPKR